RARAAEVVEAVTRRAAARLAALVTLLTLVHRGDDAVEDVVDPRVVARRAAVAEELDRLAREEVARELVDREVGPLARAVDREEAQARDVERVEVVRREELQLARPLRRRVRRQRAQAGIGLLEGRLAVAGV